jgi:CubicO group peptidase (beta-lactamase class C family)
VAVLFFWLWATLALAADAPWPTQGWVTSTPEEQGMSSAPLDGADRFIRRNSPNRFSFLVIRNGYLVYERYYNGGTAGSLGHIASISKSFLSALTGIAIEQGLVRLEDRWFNTFPEYAAVPVNARTTDLRIRHMLTMSPGLAWTDDYIFAWMWDTSGQQYPDWIRFTLGLAFENPPGEALHYNTGNTHMLSAFLTRRTGMSTRDFAVRNLLGPLGIRDLDWWREYTAPWYYTGGWGMHLAARDVAKLGYLYLHDGVWDGR